MDAPLPANENSRSAAHEPGWPQAALFDLDGTLIDSVVDLAGSVNAVLAADGRRACTVEEVRAMIGNGVKKLVARAYEATGEALDGDTLATTTDRMMTIYGERLTRETTLMEGALETLHTLKASGTRLAVVTNKPEAPTRQILAHFELTPCFDAVVGGDTGPARKPAPDMLFHALELLGVAPSAAVMVGDSPADIDSARAASIASVAVRGGYTALPAEQLGASAIIDSLAELPALFEHWAPSSETAGQGD